MKQKIEQFIVEVMTWKDAGMKGKKPYMKITFDDLSSAPLVFMEYQYLSSWVEYLLQGGNWSYREFYNDIHYKENLG